MPAKRSVLSVVLLLVLAMAVPGAWDAPFAVGEGQTSAKVLMYAMEVRGLCGPPIYPTSLGTVLAAEALKAGWSLSPAGAPPMISQETVAYSVVGTSGETSLQTARIFAEVGPGGELSYKSDKGKNVVVQVDVKKICWDIDQGKVLKAAKEAGAAKVVVARLHAIDLTAEVNPTGEMGSQKSASVTLDVQQIDTKTGSVLHAFSDEIRRMDLSLESAIRSGAQYLSKKAVAEFTATSKPAK